MKKAASRVVLPLIEEETGYQTDEYILSVPINHRDVDSLVGRLMQMCDLIGDPEQRSALKDTIKRHCRDWLDEEYEVMGYDRFSGPSKNTQTVKAKMYEMITE